jgi:hypothetical protein
MYLLDKEGRPRFQLNLDQDEDAVTLNMRDGNGTTRVLIGTSEPEGSHIVLHDAEGQMRAMVAYGPKGVSTKGTTKIALFNEQGDKSAVLVAEDGRPGLLKVGIVREQSRQKTGQDSKPDQSPPSQC